VADKAEQEISGRESQEADGNITGSQLSARTAAACCRT
jgi:hypothetical protein